MEWKCIKLRVEISKVRVPNHHISVELNIANYFIWVSDGRVSYWAFAPRGKSQAYVVNLYRLYQDVIKLRCL
jgi:hypothetical protein